MAAPPSSPNGRFLCIHGHFYQPPRENPWIESVETQDSAAPYHDWNDRVTAECYAPNGTSRIVNTRNQIVRIVNNYSRISFNFGPTLLSWLEDNAPRTYRMIREADLSSQRRFGGHGSALAQIYNHLIVPLAPERDRVTQVVWGIADFEHRFGRKPEGMWLPETAVDLDSLDLLARHGIRFTILAPHQCARVRELPELALQPSLPELGSALPGWTETPNASVDPTHPYRVRLREGRSIAVFFYNGPVSRAIAFEGLLNSGDAFAARLYGAFHADTSRPQLVHAATDGESYGHHHRYGEMALSYALKLIEDETLARLTNYGEFLAAFPPAWEAEIAENTSWSCAHGIERWRSDCGCNGGHPGWNQQWRAPLRAALDWLRDTVAPIALHASRELFYDYDAARNAYIQVVLARSASSIDHFLAEHATHPLSPPERTLALKLMEIGRHSMLMYTSCGWFFDDISGIETVQVIAYAARVLQLAEDVLRARPEARPAGQPGLEPGTLEGQFVERLRQAKSNAPEWEDGADIYVRLVKRLEVTLEQVAAHYAISSVFSNYLEETELFCYTVHRLDYEVLTSGHGRMAVGRALIRSNITEESETVSFAALHFGDQNLTAAVKRLRGAPSETEVFDKFKQKCAAAVAAANLPEAVRLVDAYFGGSPYTLNSLFLDEQRRILELILTPALREVEQNVAGIYEEHASLFHFLNANGLPRPPALTMAVGLAVNAGLRHALEDDPVSASRLRSLAALAKAEAVPVDAHLLGFLADRRMKQSMVELNAAPLDSERLEAALALVRALHELPFPPGLWQAQNIWYGTLKASAGFLEGVDPAAAARWRQRFFELGSQMHIAADQLVVEELGEESPTP